VESVGRRDVLGRESCLLHLQAGMPAPEYGKLEDDMRRFAITNSTVYKDLVARLEAERLRLAQMMQKDAQIQAEILSTIAATRNAENDNQLLGIEQAKAQAEASAVTDSARLIKRDADDVMKKAEIAKANVANLQAGLDASSKDLELRIKKFNVLEESYRNRMLVATSLQLHWDALKKAVSEPLFQVWLGTGQNPGRPDWRVILLPKNSTSRNGNLFGYNKYVHSVQLGHVLCVKLSPFTSLRWVDNDDPLNNRLSAWTDNLTWNTLERYSDFGDPLATPTGSVGIGGDIDVWSFSVVWLLPVMDLLPKA
jgi:hypothetical protein